MGGTGVVFGGGWAWGGLGVWWRAGDELMATVFVCVLAERTERLCEIASLGVQSKPRTRPPAGGLRRKSPCSPASALRTETYK